MRRTDLAMEMAANYPHDGVKITHSGAVHTVEILSQEAAKQIGKAKGRYCTVTVENFCKSPADFFEEVKQLSDVIKTFLPEDQYAPVLVAGLGNRMITPDAVGPLSVEKILVTRHLKEITLPSLPPLRSVCAISPGVMGQTGIESSAFVRRIADVAKGGCVIVIDALAAAEIQRLLTTVQICDTGISPGSGVGNCRAELSEQTIGVPVIAVGVPTVTELSFPKEGETEQFPMVITPREIDQAVEHAARTIALSINCALHPDLTIEELSALVS